MKVDVVDAKFDSFKTELIVVGLFYPAEKIPEDLKSVDEKLHGAIAHALKGKEFDGEWQQFRLVSTLDKIPAKNILLVGLGKKEDVDLELLRRAAGFSAKVARDFCGITEFSTTLHNVDVPKTSKDDRAQAVSEGSVLGAYQFIKFRTFEKERIKVIQKVTLVGDGVSASVKKGAVLAECTNLVRDLENEPASNMKPADLAEVAEDLKKLGVKVTVYDKKAMEKLGLHAVLAVNRGSINEPRFVVMEYDGGGRKVAVVGKGITFDSGGLNIKTENGMFTMKHDLAGAGVVIGTLKAAALLKLKVNLVGVFAATENMLGMDAYKPGDIISTYSGKTVEIINTDAEGRLVLCDGLAFAEKNFKPSAIVDLGTVTGACIVALGSVCAGVMGKDKKLVEHLIKSGNATGERVWELPLFREYCDQVKSDFADLRNLGIFKSEAGAITAGAFLSAFVEKAPWAHIDIAGTAWSDIDLDYVRKGGTGFGVRLLINALENWGD